MCAGADGGGLINQLFFYERKVWEVYMNWPRDVTSN